MMLATLRRCPASLSRNLPSTALSVKVIRSALSQPSPLVWRTAARVPKVTVASFHHTAKWQQVAATATESTIPNNDGVVTQFEDLKTRGLVHPNVVDTITKQMKLHTMTDVQTRTINEALSGVDIIAQAKTGTGKTLGFLIPVVQKIIAADPQLGNKPRGYKRARADDIRAIIISPTRELAEQIAAEAEKLTLNTGLIVQLAVGGTQKRQMLAKTQREGCHILVGTPGRLADIFSDHYSGITAPRLNSLVMDEADRLLDQGFEKEIEEIKSYLPTSEESGRQTMMFSATIPRDVVDLVRKTLKPNFHFAQCVNLEEPQTHERVPQKLIHVHGFENIMPTLYKMMSQAVQERSQDGGSPFKAIVYFNSTAEVKLASNLFRSLTRARNPFGRINDPNDPLAGILSFEIHSKLTQMARTKAAERFRFAKSAILFSSDVTARGMDFPNVTHVIQIGLPGSLETYIHRIGRTGRAGREGEGWLFCTHLEKYEVKKRLRGLPLVEHSTTDVAMLDMSQESDVPETTANLFKRIIDAHQNVDPEHLSSAFMGIFGAYQWYPDRQGLLEAANRWTKFGWGMPTPPNPPASLFSGGRGRQPQQSRNSFGGNDRSFGGGRSGGYRGDGQSRGGFGGNRQSRGGYGADRQSRGGYGGDRPSRGGYGGDRQSRGGYGGDRQSRSGFGDSRESGGFGRGGRNFAEN